MIDNINLIVIEIGYGVGETIATERHELYELCDFCGLSSGKEVEQYQEEPF